MERPEAISRVRLRLGGPGADSGPGNEVSDVLRHNRIKEFGGRRQTDFIHLLKNATGQTQTLFNFISAVEVRIVNQTFSSRR